MTTTECSAPLGEWMRQERPDRIAWLAGYPRSGAALVRTILANCFNHLTGSLYYEDNIGEHYAQSIKLLPSNCISLAAIQEVASAQGLLTYKTHELPAQNEHKAILIVRDARCVFDSLLKFYCERNKLTYTMRQLICGDHPWGDWSSWVRTWAVGASDDSLWLRYEDIMADVPGTVNRIAAWAGIRPVGYTIPSFDSLKAGNPTIFPACKTVGAGLMDPDDEAAFWDCHGGTMSMLGYKRE